jgi:tellurite resistance protein TerC
VPLDTLAWIVFGLLIASFLALDLFVFHREAHEVKPREALSWVCIWVTAALVFCGILYIWRGPEASGEFLAGYLIEQSLSVDNMFVFALIFGYFAVPGKLQHRLLFWGIVGAVIFRAIFIGAGAVLLKNFHWMMYVFGAFLVYTGRTAPKRPSRSPRRPRQISRRRQWGPHDVPR